MTAADLSYKRANQLGLGDSSSGIDVDEFVSKCISFMRSEPASSGRMQRLSSVGASDSQIHATQRRRRRAGAHEDDEDDDQQLDWHHLGRNACFPYNSRPCLSGFMLGPLSVQKRVRQQTQRRAREAHANPANAIRPQELRDEDMEKQETANLTVICSEIKELLYTVQKRAEEELERIFDSNPDMTDDESQALLRKYTLADDGNVPLFDFCVNPKSFGQTVENMFYISFLIKEGSVGLGFDSRGLPTLGMAVGKTVEQRQEAPRNQAVFTLDFEMFEEIVAGFGIQKSVIPNRKDEQYDDGTNEDGDAGGWYG